MGQPLNELMQDVTDDVVWPQGASCEERVFSAQLMRQTEMEALKQVGKGPWEEGDWLWGERSGQEERVSSEGCSSLAPQGCHLLAMGSARGSRSWPAFIETTSCG